jgi:putative transposase
MVSFFMPRKARIDSAGGLHHIIARGIDGSPIFQHDYDRNDFLSRFGLILKETDTHCCAWALIPNHFHLLLKTGRVPIAQVMGRLLTGYGIAYNRRHKRSGHLFQNRYKSILCQEDAYLLELVRYIHLNPLRSDVVTSFKDLDVFPYCGHSIIMNGQRNDWQDTGAVLTLFSDDVVESRIHYRRFVEKGIAIGKRDDLIGGGLIRSSGGWSNVLEQRREKLFRKSDERILGDHNFVEEALSTAEERLEGKYLIKALGFDLEKVAERVCAVLHIEKWEVYAPGKERRRVHARSLLCYWAAREVGISQAELSRELKISPAGVTFSVRRGEKLVREGGYSLLEVED